MDDPDQQGRGAVRVLPVERMRRVLVESTRQTCERDSFSCSIRFLWRQHVEIRLRQMIAYCTVLQGGNFEAPTAGALEQLWPKARQLLGEVSDALCLEMNAAEQYLDQLREASVGSQDVEYVGFPEPLGPLIGFLDSAVNELDRQTERRLGR